MNKNVKVLIKLLAIVLCFNVMIDTSIAKGATLIRSNSAGDYGYEIEHVEGEPDLWTISAKNVHRTTLEYSTIDNRSLSSALVRFENAVDELDSLYSELNYTFGITSVVAIATIASLGMSAAGVAFAKIVGGTIDGVEAANIIRLCLSIKSQEKTCQECFDQVDYTISR